MSDVSSVLLTPDVVGDLIGKRVLVVGDVMLDAYLMGDADRISPEAPVPVVRIERERYLLGGAGGGVLAGLWFRKVSARVLHIALGLLILFGGARLLLW